MKNTGRKVAAGIAGLAAAGWLVAAGTASAMIDTQKQAKAAGVAAANCMHCHGEKLPKKGASTLNERGKWLVEQKTAKKAEKVDGAWLKDYVEKK
jgi:mono/diheme cytochrome c family protein